MIKILFVCHGRTVENLANPVSMGKMGHTTADNTLLNYDNTTNERMKRP